MTDASAIRPDPVRRAPRWLLVVLFASLALNLVIVGSVAGAMWRFRKPPPWASAITPNLLGYASTLSSERRKQLWEQTAEERLHIRPFRREVRAARDETVKVLATEPFDKQQFQDAQVWQLRPRTGRGRRSRTFISRLPLASPPTSGAPSRNGASIAGRPATTCWMSRICQLANQSNRIVCGPICLSERQPLPTRCRLPLPRR